MYVGTIRRVENTTVELAGHSLEEIRDQAQAAAPEGFDLVSAPVQMIKGSTELKATATYQRRDGLRDIEADDRQALFAQVPEGWQLVNIRKH
ncbi:hypothetical protein PUW79_09055 [Microbacterium sp. NE2HP2]|jgi:hypothetical protein|uniref:Uncharacterized protein n=1 Tax=Microbacterium plantarum TaxID=1816425 RepID=A0ABV5EUA9_9MICO|nr:MULTISPECIES: hypothetical protein [Microbacterium]MDF2916389.1 hypothetical protein [Microbacterium sp.]MCZ4067858.1 hypothetical protein [Microbacterium sp. H37-C3]MDD7944775.1 hypothetical protein [Microbacterium plantarum]RAZ31355.1 hypothetical protein DO944_10380 [Microbacterium sp. SMR1]WHE35124.1 hypothetical protein P6897_10495 [Microbacterium sp. BDGP8]